MEKPPGGDSLKARLQRGFADMDQKRRRLGGGLIPPPELSLQRRIEALEARVVELERILRATHTTFPCLVASSGGGRCRTPCGGCKEQQP